MNHDEDNEQKKVVDYCKAKKILCFSVPNGSSLSGSTMQRARQMHRLKATGLLVGVSDLIVMTNNKVLFIEMKKCKKLLKNGNLSSSGISVSEFQLKFLDEVKEFDYAASTIAYGSKEAISFIEKHK